MKKLVIIGGGASGFFLAANLNKTNWKVTILEQSKHPLQKVKISGGGRCNVTHACFNPKELVKFYPRGSKELTSIFSHFQPSDTFDWFERRKVNLNIEADNRVFPDTNTSQTIIDTLLKHTEKNNIQVHYETVVSDIMNENQLFKIITSKFVYEADALIIATGSSPKMWKIISKLGHSIISPVPSLFTFNCKSPLIQNLQGTSFTEAEISIPLLKHTEYGPLLITHWGLSGPSILKLSAWKARELAELKYNFILKINWVSESFDEVKNTLNGYKVQNPKKSIYSLKPYNLTQRFWQNMLNVLDIKEKVLAELSKTDINRITETLTNTRLTINGKSTFKDEFVTAGGVNRKEIDFRTMQSKLVQNLYFAGEVIDIDAITGGFNFQACWSEAFVISQQFNIYEKN
ncbi:NAD(P)/FAD-dependent oxidoreductase [Apibacter raozihei]|uniref:NAD(P)/FAD-dependent oxidoreductase n=1 Tax=Apibacter raozihei TaxID=2500547 RepID=UPI000FE2B963|nr:NAD(P)/FAD-dependent oxidoreductase [Apibacter raozihei]